MKFSYDQETDSLYIELSTRTGTDAEEVAPGIVVDYDADGHIVGLDIEDASKNISLGDVNFSGFSPKIVAQPRA